MIDKNIYSKFNYNIEEIYEQLDSEGENYDRQEIADELYSLMRALYYNYQNEHHKMIVYRALHSELSCSEFVNMVKKSQNLGEFWTSDIESAKYFGGDWLIDSRGEGNIYIIKGECSVFDININETVVNNLLYPEENEVNINGRKVKLLDIFEYFPDTGDGHSIMSSTIISRNTLLLNKKNKKKYKLIDRLDYGFLVFEDPETKTIFLNHEKDVNDFSDKYAIHKIDDDRIKYNLKNINKYCNNETKCHYVLNEFANTVLTHIQGKEQKYIDMMADIKPSDMDKLYTTIVADKKYPQELNDNFWKWFGDSETVDNNGNPLIFYHGTRARFNKFKTKRNDNLIFFTYNKDTSYEFAKAYRSLNMKNYDKLYKEYNKNYSDFNTKDFNRVTRRLDLQSRVMPVYIKAENIFRPERDYNLVIDDIIDYRKMTTKTLNESIEHIKEGYWHFYEDDRIIDKIFRLGFDAIQLKEHLNLDKSKVLAVKYNTKQIKSIYNNGDFSKRTNNIYK